MAKVMFYPGFTPDDDFSDHYYRMMWYLLPVLPSIETIYVPYTHTRPQPEGFPHYLDERPKPTEPYFREKVRYVLADTPDKLKMLSDDADVILHWNDTVPNATGKRVYRVDHERVRHAGSFYLMAAGALVDEAALLAESRAKFERLLDEFSGETGYILGTGPHVDDLKYHDFEDHTVIVCNSMVKNHRFMKRIEPPIIVAADPIFHAGPSTYAGEFREHLVNALDTYGSYFICPMRDYAHYLTHLPPRLHDQLIGVPYQRVDEPNLNLRNDYYVTITANVMTLFLIPLATTLFDKIYMAGFDGRPADENDYFWGHDPASQFNEQMQPIRTAHPAFFAIDYDAYYERHRNDVARWLDAVDASSKEIINLSPSYVPALAERFEPGVVTKRTPHVLLICGVRVNRQSGGGVAMNNFFSRHGANAIAQIHADNSHLFTTAAVQNYHALPGNLDFDPQKSVFEQLPNAHALLRWCEAFKPDVIYYQPLTEPIYFHRLAVELALTLDVPLISHIMDNMHRLAKLPRFQQWLDEEYRYLFRFSRFCLSISDEMSADYEERFGREFIPIQQYINEDDWIHQGKDYTHVNAPFNVTYVGKLLPDMQLNALRDVAAALQRLHNDGIPVELNIYGPENTTGRYIQSIIPYGVATYHGFIPDSNYAETLRNADLLVVVGNFDRASLENIKYSMPGKIPHYMASGTAILLYSPPGLPQNNAAAREGWAAIVDEPDIDQLAGTLLDLITDDNQREQLGRRGREIAFAHYSAAAVRPRLTGIIQSAVQLHDTYPAWQQERLAERQTAGLWFNMLSKATTYHPPDEPEEKPMQPTFTLLRDRAVLLSHNQPEAAGYRTHKMSQRVVGLRQTWVENTLAHTAKRFPELAARRTSDTCIIVGNGPSLQQTDLTLLAGQDVFISNYAYLNPTLRQHATYHTIVNYLVAEQDADTINNLTGLYGLYPFYLGYVLQERANTLFFNASYSPEFTHDINAAVSGQSTVSYFNMQLAYHIGYRRVLLIGFDHSYTQPEGVKEGDYIQQTAADANHFHPDYFKGKVWQAADVGKMEASYLRAKAVFDADGREIINCTAGGALDVFPRAAFAAALRSKARPVYPLTAPLQPVPTERPPRLLLIDMTPIGSLTATGQVKRVLFDGWHPVDVMQVSALDGEQILLHRYDNTADETVDKIKTAADVLAACEDFSPEMIYYRPVPYRGQLHALAMTVIEALNLPLAVHIMDDWENALRTTDPAQHRVLSADLAGLLARADVRLSIGGRMSDALRQRYGYGFIPMANGIIPANWTRTRPTGAKGLPFIIRYVGAVADNMVRGSLLHLAEQVEALGKWHHCHLEIYTGELWQKQLYDDLANKRYVTLHDSLPDTDDYRALLMNSDLLVITYNFDADSLAYTRYSMANKMPESMASGTPILVYGPAEQATVADALANGWAAVVTDPDALEETLLTLIHDDTLRGSVARRARELAAARHHAGIVRRGMVALFSRTANPPPSLRFSREDRARFDETAFLRALLKDKRGVLVDVGAHHGSFMSGFVGAGWAAYGFEPDTDHFAALCERFENVGRVTLQQLALSDQPQADAAFYVSDVSSGIHTLTPFHDSHMLADYRVQVDTLANVLAALDVGKIDLLKVDAEGYDLRVLEGLDWERHQPDVVLCEFEDGKTVPLGYTVTDMADFLYRRGYTVLVSEWHPIVQYGTAHDWHALYPYPAALYNPEAWGNLIAFRTPPELPHLFKIASEHVRQVGAPKPQPEAPPNAVEPVLANRKPEDKPMAEQPNSSPAEPKPQPKEAAPPPRVVVPKPAPAESKTENIPKATPPAPKPDLTPGVPPRQQKTGILRKLEGLWIAALFTGVLLLYGVSGLPLNEWVALVALIPFIVVWHTRAIRRWRELEHDLRTENAYLNRQKDALLRDKNTLQSQLRAQEPILKRLEKALSEMTGTQHTHFGDITKRLETIRSQQDTLTTHDNRRQSSLDQLQQKQSDVIAQLLTLQQALTTHDAQTIEQAGQLSAALGDVRTQITGVDARVIKLGEVVATAEQLTNSTQSLQTRLRELYLNAADSLKFMSDLEERMWRINEHYRNFEDELSRQRTVEQETVDTLRTIQTALTEQLTVAMDELEQLAGDMQEVQRAVRLCSAVARYLENQQQAQLSTALQEQLAVQLIPLQEQIADLGGLRDRVAGEVRGVNDRVSALMDGLATLRGQLDTLTHDQTTGAAALQNRTDALEESVRTSLTGWLAEQSAVNRILEERLNTLHEQISATLAEMSLSDIAAQLGSTHDTLSTIRDDISATRTTLQGQSTMLTSLSALKPQVEGIQQEMRTPRFLTHNRRLDEAAIREYKTRWSRVFSLPVTDKSVLYMEQRVRDIESMSVGRLAANIEDMILRMMAAGSFKGDTVDILEIGTLFGVGLSALYDYCSGRFQRVTVTAIDTFGGYYAPTQNDIITGLPVNRETFERNMRLAGVAAADLTVLAGNSTDPAIIEAAASRRYDLIIFDGDHSYGGLRMDYRYYAPLAKRGGILVFDDYGRPEWDGVTKFVDEHIANAEDVALIGVGWHTALYRVLGDIPPGEREPNP